MTDQQITETLRSMLNDWENMTPAQQDAAADLATAKRRAKFDQCDECDEAATADTHDLESTAYRHPMWETPRHEYVPVDLDAYISAWVAVA